MKINTTILTLSGALALTLSSQAAITLTSWSFTGNNPLDHAQNDTAAGQVVAAATTYATDAAGITSTDLVGAGDLRFSNGVNGTDGNTNEVNVQSGTAAGWLLDFSVGADTGTVNITGLSINLWRNGGGAPDSMAFQVSTDGGTSFAAFGTPDSEAATGLAANRDFNFTGDITGSNVIVRFAPTSSTGNIHISDITVTGDIIPVPEPSSTALLGLGGLALILRRRK